MNAFKKNLLTSGAQRIAVIYIRQSSHKQSKEGSGAESQKQVCYDYARLKGFKVIRIFSDIESGKTTSRPGMNDMLEFLRAHRHQNIIVIIPEVSRLARDITSHIHLRTQIMEVGGELMSPSMEFSDDPTAQLSERMFALMSEHERLSINKRARAGERARLLQGYACFPAPTGYKYEKDKKLGRGSVLVKEEPVASIVKEMLEHFASGYFETQKDCKRFLEAHPDFPKTSSGKIGKSRVKDMLTNLLYAGYLEYPDRDVPLTKAVHERLISFDTYTKNQNRLAANSKQRSRMLVNPEYPLRGLVDCSCCGEALKAGRSKSRNGTYHHYYSCHTKGCEAYGKSIRRDQIEGEFGELLNQLRPSSQLLTIATRMFKASWARHNIAHEERQAAAKRMLGGIETKIDTVVSRIIKTERPTLVNAYEAELEKLEQQRIVLTEKIEGTAHNESVLGGFNETYRTAIAVISNPIILWQNQDVRLKRAAVRYAFTSRLSYDRENGYRTAKASLPFQVFQSLNPSQKENSMRLETVVGDTGIEPVTPAV